MFWDAMVFSCYRTVSSATWKIFSKILIFYSISTNCYFFRQHVTCQHASTPYFMCSSSVGKNVLKMQTKMLCITDSWQRSSVWGFINTFVHNITFQYHQITLENDKISQCFQGIWKCNSRNSLVKTKYLLLQDKC